MPPHARIEATLSLHVTIPGEVALSVAVADSAAPVEEKLRVSVAPEADVPMRVVPVAHGGRLHLLDLPEGDVTIHYTTLAEYDDAAAAEPLTDADRIVYTRPSRYCPADTLANVAVAELGGRGDTRQTVDAIVDWVGARLRYVPGASGPTDDAVATLLSRQGVCRDYAHLAVTLCRALDIPARFVSVYAPGLSPMDFHAVFEAAVDGHWYLFDATRLAPRAGMVRVATGRDAADTAFLTTLGAVADLRSSVVTVTAQPGLPAEEPGRLVVLR